MFKLLFSFFLIVHILGDFYFQSDRLSGKKQKKYGYVALHGLIYLLVSLVCAIPFWSASLAFSAVILSILHFAADSVKFAYIRGKEPNAAVFAADQLIHVFCIACAASFLSYLHYGLRFLPAISRFLSAVTGDPYSILAWAGLLLMAMKPANITIKRMVAKYKPGEEKPENSDKGEEDPGHSNRAGAYIGTLERIIILLLLSAGQYSAIGLVLTAKSVARYNKISEDAEFAEYYLLGTLMSALYAIGTYFVFM